MTPTRELTERDVIAMDIAQLRVKLARIQKTHQGHPLDFTEWPYLEDIYRDPSPDIAIMSCVKSGKSEWLIATDMAICMMHLNVLHCLPDEKVRNRFVQARVDPTIAHTPQYRAVVSKKHFSDGHKKSDSTSLKRIGNGHCNYIGTNSVAAMTEYVADAVIKDELDQCNLTNLDMAPDRMDWSLLKMDVSVGNPTIEGHGIDALWRISDQKQWHIRCRKCDTAQALDFFKQVAEPIQDDEGRATGYRLMDPKHRPLCIECGRPLNRLERSRHHAFWKQHGEPAAKYSGYQIGQMMSPRVSGVELWDRLQKAKDDPGKFQLFQRQNLGWPSRPEGAKITEAVMAKCLDQYHMPASFAPGSGTVVAGIDVGSVFYVRISSVENQFSRRCMYVGTVTGWDTLTALLKRYGVRVAVIDAAPETHSTIEWQRGYTPFTVWRADHAVSDTNVREPRFDQEKGVVHISRTACYDASFEDWKKGRQLLPSDWRSIDGYLEQMTRNTRYLDYDSRGVPVYKWTDTKPDHHWSADAFDCLACEIVRTLSPTLEVHSLGDRRAGMGDEAW